MTLDPRLDRLLARHADAMLGTGPSGGTALHRRDQLLVARDHADHAQAVIGSRVVDRREVEEADATVLHLDPAAQVDINALVAELRDHDGGPISVSANHLLRGEPGYNGGPYGPPRPCGEQPRPEPDDRDRRKVVAAVLDTGITEHPWFVGRKWFDEVPPSQYDPENLASDYALETQTGHGTFVAGVLLREAPSAHLVIERVLDDAGVCDELQLLQGLARVRARMNEDGEKLDVLNLSLGGYTLDDAPSPLVADALARFGPDTVIVAAAGNLGKQRVFWPAALKDCIAVGSLEPDGDRHAPYSNRGWWVDASAVGTDVTGPFLTGEFDGARFDGYARWSGTSFAAPKVAGVIAETAAREGLTAPEAVQQLIDRSRCVHKHGFGVVVQ